VSWGSTVTLHNAKLNPNYLRIGMGAGAGTLVVDGIGARLTTTNGGYGVVGYTKDCPGTLIITNGGTGCFDAGCAVGSLSGAVGRLVVTGTGSVWNIQYPSTWGGTGTGTALVEVASGGKIEYLTSLHTLTLRGLTTVTLDNGSLLMRDSFQPLFNQGLIQGSGSLKGGIQNSGVIDPGRTNAPGRLALTGSLTNCWNGTNGTLRFHLGSATTGTYDRLSVTGTLFATGVLEVALLGGYVPRDGASFDLMDWSACIGQFTATNLPESPGCNWITDRLYIDGVIGVRRNSSAAILIIR
jgi:hypothetical protein